uniref:Uncharacterized protein n=1 Tax=Cucumis melo TaxID=3656 RepID=A0A9I9E3P7_CUCME
MELVVESLTWRFGCRVLKVREGVFSKQQGPKWLKTTIKPNLQGTEIHESFEATYPKIKVALTPFKPRENPTLQQSQISLGGSAGKGQGPARLGAGAARLGSVQKLCACGSACDRRETRLSLRCRRCGLHAGATRLRRSTRRGSQRGRGSVTRMHAARLARGRGSGSGRWRGSSDGLRGSDDQRAAVWLGLGCDAACDLAAARRGRWEISWRSRAADGASQTAWRSAGQTRAWRAAARLDLFSDARR